MFYEENRYLEEDDIGFDTPIYNINLYDKSFLITIGKQRKLIQKKNTYYFPIYLLNKTKVQSQIGAFEFESSKDEDKDKIKPFVDTNGDIDLNRLGEPILYSFADYDYFKTITNDITPIGLKELEAEYILNKASKDDNSNEDEDEIDDSKELLSFELSRDDIQKSTLSIKKSQKVLENGVFSINKSSKRILALSEETKDDANKYKESYLESSKTRWIEKHMRNNNFDIIETSDNGDCLFDTIRLAYQQIGYETTIAILRAIVAKEVTNEQFMNYRELYQSTVAEIESINKELRKLISENKNLKERLKDTDDKNKRSEIIKKANEIKREHSSLKEKQVLYNSFLQEFSHIKNIDSLEKFREYIKTPSYWADDWAIDILERSLNMKLIIFSEKDWEQDDENNIIQCTLSNNTSKVNFDPEFYIMTTYSGNHYKLISYSNKYILSFREVPYDVKTMVVIKCMEKNSGIFSNIPDFKEFKSKLGVFEEEDDDSDIEIQLGGSGLYRLDNSTIFTFYNKSNGINKPGMASNESINKDKIHDYTQLAINKDWRKKLDDDWVSSFTLDNKKWKTVEHYYQASKFKKHNPHFYNQFSLDDASSDIAKDIEIARAAGSQKGMFKKGKKQISIRPSEIRIDSDFYGGRNKEERERALYAKFSQNEELKNILLSTNNSILRNFIVKRKPEKDISLMTIRQRLQMEN
jgi:predicted NAD-dependent protein-ADP-ribosyltransferase YbiA (DUF1768 family)